MKQIPGKLDVIQKAEEVQEKISSSGGLLQMTWAKHWHVQSGSVQLLVDFFETFLGDLEWPDNGHVLKSCTT